MTDHIAELLLADSRENLCERRGSPARGVLLHPVVHLDDFQIEVGPENFRRLARQPEERVDARGIVRCPDHWDVCF